MTNINDRINYVMDHFDYERVRKTMLALDWQWFNAEEGVPSIAELREGSRKLLERVAKTGLERQTSAKMMTGGFVAGYDTPEDVLYLEFNLCESDDTYMAEGIQDDLPEIVIDYPVR